MASLVEEMRMADVLKAKVNNVPCYLSSLNGPQFALSKQRVRVRFRILGSLLVSNSHLIRGMQRTLCDISMLTSSPSKN